jgi:SAM-dependent methyltransferase
MTQEATTMRSADEISNVAGSLFGGIGGLASRFQTLRPYICPFEEILPLVPQRARVLDVGCGAGLFLGLLAHEGRIGEGVGFDSGKGAIELANTMRNRLPDPGRVRFLHLDARADWPDGQFDVVSMIDVMHHVPVAAQEEVLSRVIRRLGAGGLFLYKDMAHRPRWRAFCNSMHDLVMAREWVHYLPVDKVDAHMERNGMARVRDGQANRYWYGHEWRLYRKAG